MTLLPTFETRSKGVDRKFHESFAIDCYHGGRNECYMAGLSSPGIWNDYDLSGAYTTGLLAIRPIDYERSFESRNIEDFLGDVMGFAWVDFKFPSTTRFPCLPVRNGSHGLFFPLEGTSFCTAPELALAVKMEAELTIRRGVIYPWRDDELRIFEDFVRVIRQLRRMYPKGSLPELYSKLIGNSLYGKTGQGLHERNVFDTGRKESVRVPECALSNAPIAAFVTGLIRAVMGEILEGIPENRVVINCITDGILTDAHEDEINLTGEICQRFQSLTNRVDLHG